MKKTAIICTALLALACSATAFAASSSETFLDKLGIPTGTKIFATETTEKEKPAEQQKQAEKATSMDLVLILDKSGSMYGLEKDTIGGFNSMLDKQRESDGTTALLDAVGNTLSQMKALPDIDAKGNKVLVVITTDGKENASKEWTYPKVKALISELQEKNFEFVFLGANIDAAEAAQNIGIKKENAVKYRNTQSGVKANFRAVNAMVADYAAGEMASGNWKKEVEEDK